MVVHTRKRYDQLTTEELVYLLRQQDRIIASLVREVQQFHSRVAVEKDERKSVGAKRRWARASPEERAAFASQGGKARAAKFKAATNGTGDGPEDSGQPD